MKSLLIICIRFLFQATFTLAITIHGQARPSCDGNSQVVANCPNIGQAVCCGFPTYGLIAQAAYFDVLHECVIGNWYSESPGSNTQCGIVRDNDVGPHKNVCLTGGNGGPGGGAAWFDLRSCAKEDQTERSKLLMLASQFPKSCKETMIPTIYGWPDNDPGVYVFKPTKEQWVEYNRLNGTTTDMEEHIRNLRQFNATYYEKIEMSPDASYAASLHY
jgi:hypothetical protein